MSNTSLSIKNTRKLLAFEMKFAGNTYAQIEEKTQYKVQTLQAYFLRGGRWYEDYQSWRKYQLELIEERFADMFTAQATAANQQIVNIAKGLLQVKIGTDKEGKPIVAPIPLKGDVVLRANQDILDRAGFKPAEKVKVEDSESVAKKIFERYKQPKKESEDAT